MKKLLALLIALCAAVGLAQSGSDSYVYMTFGGVDTLDPEGAYDTASGTILENVYETLYSYDGESITEFVPTLATDYTVSDDGTVYTYTLRDGVQFHSGNAMTCADVEYSLERMLVMNDAQSGVWFQAEAFLGDAANADDWVAAQAEEAGAESVEAWDGAEAAYEDYWTRLDGAIECQDDSTVVFTLPQVDPAFFVKLMYTNASIIDSRWAIENGEWDGTAETWREWVNRDPREGFLHDNASGTGAYRLVSWDGTDVVAEAFADYWGGEPPIQTVQVQVVDEEATRLLALQNGDADRIAVNNWGVIESQVRGLPGVVVHESPDWASTSVGAIHFNEDVVAADNVENVGSGAFDGSGIPADFFADLDVRKGFAYSFDPQEFIEQLYLGNGNVLTMALPPSFLGYDDGIPTYTYDPEAAEEAFRAAMDGELWETGFEMTISYNTGNTVRQTIAEILKANIEDLNPNFTINVRGIQWPDFLSARNAGELPISIVGWVPDYADPDNYMWTFYHSDGYYGSLLNFDSPEIDSLLEQARATTDDAERAELYSQVGQLGYELVPTLPYPQQTPFIVTTDQVQGVYRNPMLSHQFQWKDITK